jgi:NDP-sugar pyrophosphorylase family protein
MRPLTLDRPKPMLPVGGKPMLEYLVDLLRRHDVREIAINLHYRPEAIVSHFGDGSNFGVAITYSYEESLLGSAGAAKKLDWFFTEPFVVLYGDVLAEVDLSALIDLHERQGGVGTLALHRVDDPTRCGVVEWDANQRLVGFVEKPHIDDVPSNLANAGLYVLYPAILDLVRPGATSDFGTDVFPAALNRRLVLNGTCPPGYLLDIGSPERYAQAEADLLGGRFQPGLFRGRTSVAVGGRK